METYTILRAFADSWGLLGMFLFWAGAALFIYARPGASKMAKDASQIPFKED